MSRQAAPAPQPLEATTLALAAPADAGRQEYRVTGSPGSPTAIRVHVRAGYAEVVLSPSRRICVPFANVRYWE